MGLRAWLDERAGTGGLRARLARPLSRPAAWSVAIGTSLCVLAALQAASGALLAAYYKPVWDRAHASVETVLTAIPAGWFVRSVHVWGAHLILAGVLVHLVRAFHRGDYRAPRDLTWMVAVLILAAVAGAAITGQMLPLDEEGYSGALVDSGFADAVPGAGALVRGGATPGEFMLGRFFAAHAIVIPAAALALVAAHLALVARQGVAGGPGDGPTLLDCAGTAALWTLAIVATLAVVFPAGLGPPADPTEAREGVRPLWFFLPLYQAVKYLPTVVTLAAIAAAFAGALALPFIDRRGVRMAGWALLAALALFGVLGALADRTIGGFKFDTHAIPHRVR